VLAARLSAQGRAALRRRAGRMTRGIHLPDFFERRCLMFTPKPTLYRLVLLGYALILILALLLALAPQ
jgi:hypothetical protein